VPGRRQHFHCRKRNVLNRDHGVNGPESAFEATQFLTIRYAGIVLPETVMTSKLVEQRDWRRLTNKGTRTRGQPSPGYYARMLPIEDQIRAHSSIVAWRRRTTEQKSRW
jgi:hypothetical protein